MMKLSKTEQGFSLLEILVAVVVISIGLLGIASLQASAISATTASGMRGDAAISVSNLTAHMRANQAYWNQQAAVDGSQTITVSVIDGISGALASTDQDCSAGACTPQELAAYDLQSWLEFVNGRFIHPETVITLRSPDNNLLSIELSWFEKANNSIMNTDGDLVNTGSARSYTVMVSL